MRGAISLNGGAEMSQRVNHDGRQNGRERAPGVVSLRRR
jgi:hypothetical protein